MSLSVVDTTTTLQTFGCTSDFSLLNSLINRIWISLIPVFGLSLECLMFQVRAQYCRALTSVAFFILSSINPYASHTNFTMNQDWSGSSFHNLLNTCNFIVLAILNHSGNGGGMGEDGGDGAKARGGVGGGGMCGILCLIKWISLCKLFLVPS